MKKMLITGFEPFGGEKVNPSWEAVKLLPDEIGNIRLIKREVCVEYERSGAELKKLYAEHAPDYIVCCGQAGGRKAVTPEACALNRDHAEAPDNCGEVRRYREIVPGGENACFTALSVEKMVDAAKAAGCNVAPSFHAGTYVCNHIYYTALTLTPESLFIHVPFIPSQTEGKPFPSMELTDIARAIREMLAAL